MQNNIDDNNKQGREYNKKNDDEDTPTVGGE